MKIYYINYKSTGTSKLFFGTDNNFSIEIKNTSIVNFLDKLEEYANQQNIELELLPII